MSSSDELIKPDENFSKWTPLVPDQLEQHDLATDDIQGRKDPELEKAFKNLYEKEQFTKKVFSPLYGKAEEEISDEDDVVDQDPVDDEVDTEDVAAEASEAPPDFEAIKREAYEEGFSKGETEGYDAGIKAANEKTERLVLILKELEVLWRNLLNTSEEKIIELIARISEKVVYGSVAVDNTIITRAILDVFEKIPDPVNATITVNPADYEYIEVVKDDFFEEIKGLKQVSIVSDQLIEPGGCRIETSAGEVDTSIEERLEAVKRSVIDIAEKLKA